MGYRLVDDPAPWVVTATDLALNKRERHRAERSSFHFTGANVNCRVNCSEVLPQ